MNRTVAAAVVCALVAWPSLAWAKASVTPDSVIIVGANNTAASMAADIADPSVFSYEPALGRAVITRNLIVAGELTLGSEEEWDGLLKHALVLELDVTECGSARIEVVRRSDGVGHLKLHRAKITATHREQDLDECTEGNLLTVAGKLAMQHSTVTGNINVQYEPGAEVDLRDSTVSFTRVSGMEMSGLRAPGVRIADAYSVDNGMYGLSVTRLLDSPLEVARSVFRGLAADVFNGGEADVVLTDCDFRTVRFGGRSGSVRRQWTVKCELPHAGAEVAATSLGEAGTPEERRAIAGADGTCDLVLTEYVATPDAPLPVAGRNMLTPHELIVRDRPGGKPLYRLKGLHTFMRGQEVRFP